MEGRLTLRILNFGCQARHDLITSLASFNDPQSISDYSALLIDPVTMGISPSVPNIKRRDRELTELVFEKGGIVVSYLRADFSILNSFSAMGIICGSAQPLSRLMQSSIDVGAGTTISLVRSAFGPVSQYMRILEKDLRFEAFLVASVKEISDVHGAVVANNSVGYPVAVEFEVAKGRICFVPISGLPPERLGAAMVAIVRAHYGGPRELIGPEWAIPIKIPGADVHDAEILALESKEAALKAEVAALREARAALEGFKKLLYGTGKHVLEPVVRKAMRLFGFEVPEPGECAGDWDVEMKDPDSSATAIAEVEGPEGQVGVEKFRQLLSYVTDEVLAGRKHKGVLIGNGYRLLEPDAPEREAQFTEHALRGCEANSYCMAPCTEIFKAVIAVLESKKSDELKAEIRRSLLSKTGVWTFGN
jgi:hypothetical protein